MGSITKRRADKSPSTKTNIHGASRFATEVDADFMVQLWSSNCLRVQITLFESFGAKLAVQERYNQSLFRRAHSHSLRGIAVRPLPCNYYVIQ
jgi:hypothetical protein